MIYSEVQDESSDICESPTFSEINFDFHCSTDVDYSEQIIGGFFSTLNKSSFLSYKGPKKYFYTDVSFIEDISFVENHNSSFDNNCNCHDGKDNLENNYFSIQHVNISTENKSEHKYSTKNSAGNTANQTIDFHDKNVSEQIISKSCDLVNGLHEDLDNQERKNIECDNLCMSHLVTNDLPISNEKEAIRTPNLLDFSSHSNPVQSFTHNTCSTYENKEENQSVSFTESILNSYSVISEDSEKELIKNNFDLLDSFSSIDENDIETYSSSEKNLESVYFLTSVKSVNSNSEFMKSKINMENERENDSSDISLPEISSNSDNNIKYTENENGNGNENQDTSITDQIIKNSINEHDSTSNFVDSDQDSKNDLIIHTIKADINEQKSNKCSDSNHEIRTELHIYENDDPDIQPIFTPRKKRGSFRGSTQSLPQNLDEIPDCLRQHDLIMKAHKEGTPFNRLELEKTTKHFDLSTNKSTSFENLTNATDNENKVPYTPTPPKRRSRSYSIDCIPMTLNMMNQSADAESSSETPTKPQRIRRHSVYEKSPSGVYSKYSSPDPHMNTFHRHPMFTNTMERASVRLLESIDQRTSTPLSKNNVYSASLSSLSRSNEQLSPHKKTLSLSRSFRNLFTGNKDHKSPPCMPNLLKRKKRRRRYIENELNETIPEDTSFTNSIETFESIFKNDSDLMDNSGASILKHGSPQRRRSFTFNKDDEHVHFGDTVVIDDSITSQMLVDKNGKHYPTSPYPDSRKFSIDLDETKSPLDCLKYVRSAIKELTTIDRSVSEMKIEDLPDEFITNYSKSIKLAISELDTAFDKLSNSDLKSSKSIDDTQNHIDKAIEELFISQPENISLASVDKAVDCLTRLDYIINKLKDITNFFPSNNDSSIDSDTHIMCSWYVQPLNNESSDNSDLPNKEMVLKYLTNTERALLDLTTTDLNCNTHNKAKVISSLQNIKASLDTIKSCKKLFNPISFESEYNSYLPTEELVNDYVKRLDCTTLLLQEDINDKILHVKIEEIAVEYASLISNIVNDIQTCLKNECLPSSSTVSDYSNSIENALEDINCLPCISTVDDYSNYIEKAVNDINFFDSGKSEPVNSPKLDAKPDSKIPLDLSTGNLIGMVFSPWSITDYLVSAICVEIADEVLPKNLSKENNNSRDNLNNLTHSGNLITYANDILCNDIQNVYDHLIPEITISIYDRSRSNSFRNEPILPKEEDFPEYYACINEDHLKSKSSGESNDDDDDQDSIEDDILSDAIISAREDILISLQNENDFYYSSDEDPDFEKNCSVENSCLESTQINNEFFENEKIKSTVPIINIENENEVTLLSGK